SRSALAVPLTPTAAFPVAANSAGKPCRCARCRRAARAPGSARHELRTARTGAHPAGAGQTKTGETSYGHTCSAFTSTGPVRLDVAVDVCGMSARGALG